MLRLNMITLLPTPLPGEFIGQLGQFFYIQIFPRPAKQLNTLKKQEIIFLALNFKNHIQKAKVK